MLKPATTPALQPVVKKVRFVLGIETSCDETGIALFDGEKEAIIAHALYSQIDDHQKYGGVVPEIASRSQLEKIMPVTQTTLQKAGLSLADLDAIAVTNRPGLAGSLLVGLSFAKGLAWALNKPIIGINHLEGHLFSCFLQADGSVNKAITFPFIALTASGGHTAFYLVKDFGDYELLAKTIDDAAGELFDKVAKMLGYGYPGGATIEKLARAQEFKDFFAYPRTKKSDKELFFSFSGLKTAVLYDLVSKGVYDLQSGPLLEKLTQQTREKVSSSLLCCVGDIFEKNMLRAFERYPEITACAFVGGVACNAYLRGRLAKVAEQKSKTFFYSAPQFSTDNGAMIAFVGSYKAAQGLYDSLALDIKLS